MPKPWSIEVEYLPENKELWLVFDMSNGNKGARRYVWWFDTRQQARDFLKEQRSRGDRSPRYSTPRKATISGS